MTCGFDAAPVPEVVYRVARGDDAWTWVDWGYSNEGVFGERYDDPRGQYRVLYAASSRVGAFMEVLDSHRPRPGEPTKALPREWLAKRCLGTAYLDGEYADLTTSRAFAALERSLPAAMRTHRITKIDVSIITSRRKNHMAFTRDASRHIYTCAQPAAEHPFAGIHYLSRPAPENRNWAIFERTTSRGFTPRGSRPISPDDPDLLRALSVLNLTLA